MPYFYYLILKILNLAKDMILKSCGWGIVLVLGGSLRVCEVTVGV